MAATMTSSNTLSQAASVMTKPLEREAVRLSTTARKLSLFIFVLAMGLAFFWMVRGYSGRQEMSYQNLTTLLGANRLTANNLGELRNRLASPDDKTLYQFLMDHHKGNIIHGEQKNVITEVFRAIGHESSQVGIALVVQLFSDVYYSWPKSAFSEETRISLEKMIKKLESTIDMPLLDHSENDTAGDIPVNERLQLVKKELSKVKNLGKIKEFRKDSPSTYNSPESLAKYIQHVLDIDMCGSYLKTVEKARVEKMRGTSREAEHEDNKKKKATKPPTKIYIPKESELLAAIKAMEELQVFLEDKVG